LYTLSIYLKESNLLIGAIGLHVTKEAHRGEVGYWIGKDFWGQGYASEAAGEMIRFGFEELALNKIDDSELTRNPASMRVLEKVGMKKEGILRQHADRWGNLMILPALAFCEMSGKVNDKGAIG
jgi:ribosomal-protein-alanine N-acetyltransferase